MALAGKSVEIFLIANVDKWVKGLDQATSKADEFGRKLKQQKNIADMTFKAGAALVVSAAGMVAATVGPAMKLEDSVNRVAALTGKTGTAFTALTTKLSVDAKKLSVQMGASLDNVTAAYQAAVVNGIDPTTEAFNRFVTQALQVATVTGQDVATNIALADEVLDRFGKKLSDAPDALAELYQMSTSAEGGFAPFLQTLGQAGQIAGQLDVPLKQVAATVALMSQQGISGSRAGIALGNTLMRLSGASDNASDSLHKLGIEIIDPTTGKVKDLADVFDQLRSVLEDMDETEANKLLTELAGPGGVRALGGLLRNTTGDFKSLFGAMEDGTPLQEAFNERTKATDFQMKQMKASIENARVEIGSAFLPVIADMAKGLTDIMTVFRPFVEEHKSAIAPITGVTIAVGLLGIAVGKAAIAIKTMQIMLPGLAAAFGPVALAVTGLTAAMWLLADANRKIKEVGDEMVAGLPTTIEATNAEIARLEAELFDLYKAVEPNVNAIQWLEERITSLKERLNTLPTTEETAQTFDAMASGSRSAASAASEQAAAYEDVFEAYAAIRSIEREGKWKGMEYQEGRTGLEGPQQTVAASMEEQTELIQSEYGKWVAAAGESSALMHAYFYDAFDSMMRDMPFFVDGFIESVSSMVDAGKDLFSSLKDSFGKVLVDMLKMFIKYLIQQIIAKKIAGVASAAIDWAGKLGWGGIAVIVGIAAAVIAGLNSLSKNISGFAEGGVVPKTGLILAHAGERVINPARNTAMEMANMMRGTPLAGAVATGAGGPIYFHMPIYGPVSSELDMEKIMRKAADTFRASTSG